MYEKSMRISNSMDYTDLINISIRHLEANPQDKPMFKHVVIDEFQDTSDAQYRLMQLISENATLFCVGDIDQSIYEWRGATPANVTRYIKEYDAEIMRLSDNYRSMPAIVHGASALIQNNWSRLEMTMNPISAQDGSIRYFEPETQMEQGDKIAAEIFNLQRKSPHETIGILYRKNMSSMMVEKSLFQRGISYTIKKDVGFMNRREIQSVISLLKSISNPKDTQSFILNMAHFVGGVSMDKSIEISEALRAGFTFEKSESLMPDECVCMGKSSLSHPVSIGCVKLNKPTQKRLGLFLQSMKLMSQEALKKGGVQHIADELVQGEWFGKLTKFSGDDPKKSIERQENVKELLKWAMNGQELNDFLDSILLDIGSETEDSSVSLMTIHGSKGLEFDHVYLIDVSEAGFTGQVSLAWEYEEARRLMYVAMTRAKNALTITSPVKYMSFGTRKHGSEEVKSSPCHFLWEIPAQYMPNRPFNEGSPHPFEFLIQNKDSKAEINI